MSTSFDPARRLVFITAKLQGPSANYSVALALDTGATTTVISTTILESIGVDLAAPAEMVRVTMGNGVEYAPVFEIEAITALERERRNFPVVGRDLPPDTAIDGVLGLDFLRGQQLTIDFRARLITLA